MVLVEVVVDGLILAKAAEESLEEKDPCVYWPAAGAG